MAGDQAIQVPASCRVVGVARPTRDSEIGFELWLPDGWTGRYAQLGNGGFAGNIDHPSLAAEIRRGNAAAMTDTGHKAGQFDASWAFGHPEKVIDYGYRSIKATADAANHLVREYYGRQPQRRYYIGCSNGGRQALMAAQRYPDDWDGILAGSPAVQWTRQLAAFAAFQQRLRSKPENWIPHAKLPAIQRAAMRECTGQIVRCRIDVGRLICRGADRPGCLTMGQAASLELIQSGPDDFPFGFDPRFAAIPDNWDRWILNADRDAPSELAFATQAYRYLVLDRPGWRVEQFDPKDDAARASRRVVAGQPLSAILDTDDPNLDRFARHGGKLIIYVGGADAVILPGPAIDYYRRLMRNARASRARTFARLFVAPGMQHCQGGPAPNAFGQAWVAPGLSADPRHDIRSALEAWVERSRPPTAIVAAKFKADRIGAALTATQELRPYPASAGPIITVRP
ncbi:MAG TPA: tannase/feruloyl esterase family alpha/beta hydrolase [Sphingomicrobium sp.]|nr:tannase/feruloyl esterase family alpha/beta hydrolase [Sphingomicrobium sp.]